MMRAIPMALPTASEHDEQVALLRMVASRQAQYPALGLLFAIPNGDERTPQAGARLKAEGVRPGIPDLFLPVARNNYHGLFIEMKIRRGQVRPEQRAWGAALTHQGYSVQVCYGWAMAWGVLCAYLDIPWEAAP